MSAKYIKISKSETYALVEKAQHGDSIAQETIINQNTGLVKNIAVKFVGYGYELEDLLQVGYIGLIKAVQKFDMSYDVMFSTYAVPMILGEIKRYIRDDGRIKVSRQLKTDMKKMRQFEEQFFNVKGRAPRLSELAEMMGVSVERVMEVSEAFNQLSNMESLDNPEKYFDAAIVMESRESSEEKTVDMIQLKTIILTLAEKERQVIVLRYFKDMTQQQVASRLGISQVQVSRIEKKTLEKIKMEFA